MKGRWDVLVLNSWREEDDAMARWMSGWLDERVDRRVCAPGSGVEEES